MRRLPALFALPIYAATLLFGGGCRDDAKNTEGSPPPETSGPVAPAPTVEVPAPAIEVPAGVGAQPQALLAAAIRTLEGRDSISAEIQQEVDLFDKQLVGSGIYLEQRRGPLRLLRMELKLPLADRASSQVQVCDGTYLWIYRSAGEKISDLSRIKVDEANRALEEAEATAGPADSGLLPGLGGLPKLLRGLHQTFEFTTADRGTFDGVPVWRLQGRWKPECLLDLLPDQRKTLEAGKLPNLELLPEHLPDRVVVLLGQDDLFPYRFEYRRSLPNKEGKSPDETSSPLVTMQLYNVQINTPIDPNRFIYNPGDLEPTDATDAFIKSLKSP